MKKSAICLMLFLTLLFVVSCGGSKNDDKTDSGDSGETVTDEDTSDTEPAGDSEPSDTTPDDGDSTDSTPDDGDSTDSTPNDDDSVDTTPEPNDDADSIDDSSDSVSDDDADTVAETPCNPNPCAEVEHSTKECESEGVGYYCGCVENYDWNGSECKQIAPVCGETSETPCYDEESKLYWSSIKELGSLDEMTARCNGIVDGYDGWYVPTIDDLRTLVVGCDKIQPGGICPVTAENSLNLDFDYEDCHCGGTGNSNKLHDDVALVSSTKKENGSIWIVDFGSARIEDDRDTGGKMRCASKHLTNLKVIGRICSGQNTCYKKTGEQETSYGVEEVYEQMDCSIPDEGFAGQDAQYALQGYCVPVSFTVAMSGPDRDETVIDNNLGLEWQRTTPSTQYKFEDAKKFCTDSVYGGYDDWRMPTAHEMSSILNFAPFDAYYMYDYYFPDIVAWNRIEHGFWTSSSSQKDGFFVVNPWYGAATLPIGHYSGDPDEANILCVRGKVLDPKGGFAVKTLNGDKVVVDYETHLTWQPPSNAESYNWQEALSYCETSVYAGYDDWRLPNIKELESLIHYGKEEGHTTDFPEEFLNNLRDYYSFWSSTTEIGGDKNWAFYLRDGGTMFYGRKNSDFAVMCVR